MSSLTIKEAVNLMRKGVMSPFELVRSCQQRAQLTKQMNIFINETDPAVLANQCRAAERSYARGNNRILEGIPIAFKDNFCTRSMPTTCSSKMLLDFIPPYDATMVERIDQAGGLNIGKVNMDEFAMGAGCVDGYFGPTVNPWTLLNEPTDEILNSDTSGKYPSFDFYISGGSSGGSAAAVAAGACLAAFASDTGGSTRVPASNCGVVGFKPTYGLLSRHGLIPLVNSLDCPGLVTKSVEDIAIILNAVAGHDVNDSTSVEESYSPFEIDSDLDLSTLHIGIPKEYHAPGLSEDVLSLWTEMADELEKAGAKVSEVSLPNMSQALKCYQVLSCAEIASNFCRYTGIEFGLRCGSEESTEELLAENRHHGFNDVVRRRILAGNFYLLKKNYDKYYLQAQRVRRMISDDFRKVFRSGVNYLLIPTTLGDAPLYSWYTQKENRERCADQDIFTMPSNLAGIPAVTMPLQLSQRNLPISLMLLGPHFSESGLLSVAHWIERHAQFEQLDLSFLHSVEEADKLTIEE